jgi:hypothetical protein
MLFVKLVSYCLVQQAEDMDVLVDKLLPKPAALYKLKLDANACPV